MLGEMKWGRVFDPNCLAFDSANQFTRLQGFYE